MKIKSIQTVAIPALIKTCISNSTSISICCRYI